jgi:hypothetical protein
MIASRITTLPAFVALVAAGWSTTSLEQKPASAPEPTAAAVPKSAPAPASVPLNPAGAPPPMSVSDRVMSTRGAC